MEYEKSFTRRNILPTYSEQLKDSGHNFKHNFNILLTENRSFCLNLMSKNNQVNFQEYPPELSSRYELIAIVEFIPL